MGAGVQSGWRLRLAQVLPWVTGIWFFAELLSLRLGLLSPFFFDTAHADVQGIDYFSLPKAWLNLQAGHSLYGTFDPPPYGPHFTWYLAHPLLALVLGGPLSRLDPMDSYGVFTVLSLAVMAACAWLLARESDDALVRRGLWLLLLGAFPTYLMLWVGNVQPFTVLGLTLLFLGMLRVLRRGQAAGAYVLAGLLISLFTKPVVLLMLPLLLLLRETRRQAFWALGIYLPVSLLCLVVPAVNPEGVGLSRVVWLVTHPAFVKATMDIYANGMALTPDMRDNSVHWLNLVAQSGFRFHHIDVDSLPAFLDGIFGTRTPDWIYWTPTLAVLSLSVGVARLREDARRREAALLLLLAASLNFFLAYPTAWEYQYTAVLPVGAVLLLLGPRSLLGPLRAWCLGLAAFAWLPSLYVLLGTGAPTARQVALVQLDRVVPVTLLFLLLTWVVGKACLRDAWRSTPRRQLPEAV